MWLPSITRIPPSQWFAKGNSKLKIAVVVSAALVCTAPIVYFGLLAPAASRLEAREAERSELMRRYAEAVLFERQKPALAKLMAGVPSQNDMPLLVKDLVQDARRLHLSVASVKYDIPARSLSDVAMLGFSFPAEGRYPDIKRFIHDVETSGRLVGIKALKLTSDKGRVTMEMKLVTYIKER
jgi:Tfp pilus assembly protein PilO